MTEYLQSAKSNLETILFSLLLLFLPTQFGKHFWLPSSYVLGQRIDYLSPTLYTTDILVFLLFLSFSIRIIAQQRIKNNIFHLLSFLRRQESIKIFSSHKYYFLVSCFLLFVSCINIYFALSPIQSLYGFVKLLEIIFVAFYTICFFCNQEKLFLWPLVIGIVFESILALAQFYQQGSIGGLLYFLGERTFTSVTPGIANASLHGELILRPYGTFPHPNVLASYLLIGMTILVVRSKYKVVYIKSFLAILTIIIGTVGLFLTLSRVAILVWIIMLIFLFLRNALKKLPTTYYLLLANCFLLLLLFVFPLILPRFTQLNLQDESVIVREQLSYNALQMIFQHPLLGVGLHNFLLALPAFYTGSLGIFTIQPVHNIFLLIASETGLIGLWLAVAFVIWLYITLFKKLRNNNPSLVRNDSILSLLLFTEIMVLGSFDHYFLTIQQGQLLLGIVIGVCLKVARDIPTQKQ